MRAGSKTNIWSRILPDVAAIVGLWLFWLYYCKNIFSDFFIKSYTLGNHVDAIGQFWMSWWASKAFATEGASPFFCPLINYPAGGEVMVYDVAFGNILLSGLFRPLLGPNGAVNLVFSFSLLFSLMTAYFLARQLSRSVLLSALLAALPMIYATRYGSGFVDIDMANLGWMCLAVGFWIAALKKDRPWLFIVAGITLGIASITQMYYGICLFMLFTFGAAALYFRLLPLENAHPAQWRWTAGSIVIGFLVTLPYLWIPMGSLSKVKPPPAIKYMADYNPGVTHSDMGILALAALMLLLLAYFAFGRKYKPLLFWIAVACIFCLFAAGTHYRPFWSDTWYPLPFLVIKNHVPFFWRFNFTDRFGRMAVVLLITIIALLTRRKLDLESVSGPMKTVTILTAFAFGNLLAPLMIGKAPFSPNYLAPVGTTDFMQAPKYVHRMTENKMEYVVFELYCQAGNPHSALFQMYHQQPVAGDPVRPGGFGNPQKASELTALQDRVCLASVEGNWFDLPGMGWFIERSVRYVIVSEEFAKRGGPEFTSRLQAAFGYPTHKSQSFRFYDLWSLGQ